MKFLDPVIHYLETLAPTIPIELFVLLGSFVEEVLAPIPSPIVMTLAGSILEAQNRPLIAISWLALFGATGKTAGAWILYYLADKMEDLVVGKLGKFLGVTHKDIESIGSRLTGGWKDFLFLFAARALPIIPSAPVSLGSGVIKVKRSTYLLSTFTGTYVRDLMYLYLGYAGLGNYKEISQGLEGIEDMGQIALLIVIAAVVVWAYWRRHKNSSSSQTDSK